MSANVQREKFRQFWIVRPRDRRPLVPLPPEPTERPATAEAFARALPAASCDELEAAAAAPVDDHQDSLLLVKNADGSTYLWNGVDLKKRIEFASIGLKLCLSSDEIEAELRRSVYDQISQKDLDSTIVLNSKTLIEKDADFAKFAGRIQLTYIYEEVLGWDILRDGIGKLKEFHQRAFRKAMEHGIAIKRYSPRLRDYDLDRLAAALDPSADLEFDFLGIQTLYDRYLIIDKTAKPARRLETPQNSCPVLRTSTPPIEVADRRYPGVRHRRELFDSLLARIVMKPDEMIRTSLPSRMVFALPSSKR